MERQRINVERYFGVLREKAEHKTINVKYASAPSTDYKLPGFYGLPRFANPKQGHVCGNGKGAAFARVVR
jgi:hypothetical protein